MKINILVISAHPDDAEMSCGGTIISHSKQGHKMGLIDLTMGELGTRGTPQLRLEEAENARKILGAEFRENLGMADGFFKNDQTHMLMVIEKIRQYQPDIILTNSPDDRHPDHCRAAALVKDAYFMAGLREIKTNFEGTEQEAWRPKALYHYLQHTLHRPDFIVDISGYLEQKMEAIQAFSSQFYNPESDEPDTVLSTPGFLERLRSASKTMGNQIFTDAGEGFIENRVHGVSDLNNLL